MTNPKLPRAPGALAWEPPRTIAGLLAIARDWKRNPTNLEWDEVEIVMEGILHVLGHKP
jgi:hypothetical protein